MNDLYFSIRKSLREQLSWKIVSFLKPLYFLIRRNRKAWQVQHADLQAMPAGSLGHDIWLFLSGNQLSLMPKAEFHDVYHVLFEYGTHIRDEACIQFVPLGNGRWTLPNLMSTSLSALFYPEYWAEFQAAYQRGKQAEPFHHLDFEALLEVPTKTLRMQIFGYESRLDRA